MTGYYTTDFPNEPPTYFNFLEKYLGLNVSQSLMATKVKVLEYNEEVEVVFQSTNVFNSSQNHPMHMHGNSFYVVGMGEGIFDKDKDPKGYNLVDPPYQNNAIVPKYGWFALRFRASNPGMFYNMTLNIRFFSLLGSIDSILLTLLNVGIVDRSMVFALSR